jgi:hypothetical protein
MRFLGMPINDVRQFMYWHWEADMRIARIVAAFVVSVVMALAVVATANADPPDMTHNSVFPGMTHN